MSISTETDIAAINDVGQRLAQAWAAGDATAYGAAFTEDADYVVFNGVHLAGREAIVQGHRWLFEGPLKGSRIGGSKASSAPSLRFLCPEVAVAVTEGGVLAATQDKPPQDRESVQTTVFAKKDGEWLIASFQNTRKSS